MTMAVKGGGGSVSNAVLAEKLDGLTQRFADLVGEVRALREASVSRELYDAHRAATDAEIARIRDECRATTAELRRDLEAEREGRAALRRQLITTTVTGGFTLAAAVIGLVASVLSG